MLLCVWLCASTVARRRYSPFICIYSFLMMVSIFASRSSSCKYSTPSMALTRPPRERLQCRRASTSSVLMRGHDKALSIYAAVIFCSFQKCSHSKALAFKQPLSGLKCWQLWISSLERHYLPLSHWLSVFLSMPFSKALIKKHVSSMDHHPKLGYLTVISGFALVLRSCSLTMSNTLFWSWFFLFLSKSCIQGVFSLSLDVLVSDAVVGHRHWMNKLTCGFLLAGSRVYPFVLFTFVEWTNLCLHRELLILIFVLDFKPLKWPSLPWLY